jgi:signal transduction histidine kinase
VGGWSGWLQAAQRYGLSCLFTCAVIAGRWALNPLWGLQSNRHLVFLPTVILVAWFAGFGPGLLATALSTLAMWHFWMDPNRRAVLAIIDLSLFFAIGVAISALVESLRRARARADAAARAREQVLAVVAHDLRNPLASIRMTLAGLEEAMPDAETLQKRFAAMDRSARRMDSLIRDLIDVTRIEHGELVLKLELQPADAIAREATDNFASIAQNKGIEFEVVAPPDLPVPCDRDRLLQVIGNLIANALRFTPRGGRVVLRIEQHAGKTRFAVEDSGVGIKPADLPHIFEPYWHSDSKGTGLGLYIAKHLVRAHGSHIEVVSRPGEGSKFWFDLPPHEAQPKPAPAKAQRALA